MKLSRRDMVALTAMHGMLGGLKSWDILSKGDFSPEEDTEMAVVIEKSFKCADEFIKQGRIKK